MSSSHPHSHPHNLHLHTTPKSPKTAPASGMISPTIFSTPLSPPPPVKTPYAKSPTNVLPAKRSRSSGGSMPPPASPGGFPVRRRSQTPVVYSPGASRTRKFYVCGDYARWFAKGSLYVKVGTFNVMNLVAEGIEVKGRNFKYSKEEVDAKVQWISEQLTRMDCSIVGFSEVYSPDLLQQAIKASKMYENCGEVVCLEKEEDRPHVCLFSAFPVVEKTLIKNFPKEALLEHDGFEFPMKKFKIPVLKCVIELPTADKLQVCVYVVHAKSKRPDTPEKHRYDPKLTAVASAAALAQRAAEAAALRVLLLDEIRNHDRPVIVIGDLNDTVHSVSTEMVSGTPPWKKLSRGMKQDIWDVLLYSANEVQIRQSDRDVTYTHIFNGRYEVLDHILVSKDFVRTYPYHRGYVQFVQHFNDHLVDETFEEVAPTQPQSDHGQVVAVIKLFGKADSGKKKTNLYVSDSESDWETDDDDDDSEEELTLSSHVKTSKSPIGFP